MVLIIFKRMNEKTNKREIARNPESFLLFGSIKNFSKFRAIPIRCYPVVNRSEDLLRIEIFV